MVKMAWIKLWDFTSFSVPFISLVSPFAEVSMDIGDELRIGKGYKVS